jgi:hypothetical protein
MYVMQRLVLEKGGTEELDKVGYTIWALPSAGLSVTSPGSCGLSTPIPNAIDSSRTAVAGSISSITCVKS